MRVFQKIFSLTLAIILLVSTIPIQTGFAQNDDTIDVSMKVKIDENEINKGEKGVNYNVKYIDLSFDSNLTLNKSLNEIAILVNGEKDADHFKFEYSIQNNEIRITLKDGPGDNTYMHPLELRRHTLYNISIPKGFFINAQGKESKGINFPFVTEGDEKSIYPQDIIKETKPTKNQVDYQNGTITFSFVDDIEFCTELFTEENRENNKSDYITIHTTSMMDPKVELYGEDIPDSIDNYEVSIEGNELILKSKSGKLKDFAEYEVTIKTNTVLLKNTKELENGKEIYNDEQTLKFNTDDLVNWSSIYPQNNQEDVEINPLIQIPFKYSIKDIDKTKITLSSDGNIFAIDMDKHIWITPDQRTLKIDINSLYRDGKHPLRKNTVYKITIDKEALTFTDHKYSIDDSDKYKEQIYLYFITGQREVPKDPGLDIIKYTSDMQNDDITSIGSTRLNKDGNIYIHFNRSIQWNGILDTEAKAYFRLLKIPKADSNEYDPAGKIYDKKVIYPNTEEEEVPVDKVEILKDANGKNLNIIKITPRHELVHLNGYYIKLDNTDIIIDDYQKKLRENINQKIWTCPTNDKNHPKWLVDFIKAESIKEDKDAPYKKYTLFGVPQYSKATPIIIHLDREIIVNPHLKDPLSEITLYEGDTDKMVSTIKLNIDQYHLEYYFEGNAKKTKFYLYPDKTLRSGSYYQLDIPNNTFVTRGNVPTEKLQLNFVIEGNQTLETGIYNLLISPKKEITVLDFVYKEVDVTILGYNFNEEMKNISLIREKDGKEIKIPKEHIFFQDVTKILIKINGMLAQELAKEENVGIYEIWIKNESDDLICKGGTFEVQSKGRPKRIRVSPEGVEAAENPIRYDEFTFYTKKIGEKTVYHMIIVFEDIDHKVYLANTDPSVCRLSIPGTDKNFVDEEGVILGERKGNEFYVYIPLKDKVNSGEKYTAFIAENIVKNNTKDQLGNEAYSWIFYTNFIPIAKDVIIGSVVEDYSKNEEILIKGDLFYEHGIKVYFRNVAGEEIEAEYVRIREVTDPKTGKKEVIAYVELPQGRNKLEVGMYDIVVKNDSNHKNEFVYDVLSVVRAGDHRKIPNEEYKLKDNGKYGEVRGDLKISKDTLLLSPSDINAREVNVNLDEAMGIDTYIRKIWYEGETRYKIGMLKTKSKWADVTLYGLTLQPYINDDKIEMSLGRVEPIVAKTLNQKLRGKGVLSDFIQVSGKNFKLDNIKLSIPFKHTTAKNIKVLRYDELTRNFYEEYATINLVDGKVELMCPRVGIFVVVTN
ncbi:hypothetical protein [Anaerophilus nitritogenes]|uniref:hypothetical protein n=1 Tax=Anaerophilus nitritogenes TaxID=2498136 RepID=UPI00101D4FDE|nr:hypothetical protein [Anaerophilus nitritogenes]